MVIFSLILTIIAVIGSPLWVTFADSKGNLPNWLSWLQTTDNTLDGDYGWNDPTQHPVMNKLTPFWKRVCWMIRNPGGGFDQNVVGINITSQVNYIGNPKVNNQNNTQGYCIAWNKQGWMIYFVTQDETNTCIRGYFGWKLMDSVDNPNFTGRLPLVFSFNPFMGYS
jgi:hypothetical protein